MDAASHGDDQSKGENFGEHFEAFDVYLIDYRFSAKPCLYIHIFLI